MTLATIRTKFINVASQPEAKEAHIRLLQTREEWWTATCGFNEASHLRIRRANG